MTYVIEVWNDHTSKKILKGFDGDKPLYVTRHKWMKGSPVQECGSEQEAMYWLKKIESFEHWRGRAIVEVH